MEKILAILQDLLQQARHLIDDYKAKLSDLELRESHLAADKAVHAQKSQEINDRESAIVPIENFNARVKDLEQRESDLSQQKAMLEEQKTKFKTYYDAMKQSLDNQQNENQQMSEGLDKRKNAMEEEVKSKIQAIVDNLKLKV